MNFCKICSINFKPNIYTPNQKYCSSKCASEAHKIGRRKNKRRELFKRECVYCLKNFETKTHNKLACSKKCQRNIERAKFYKISNLEFKTLQAVNNCQICYKSFNGNKCIDHSHNDGTVRGVLCHSCNIGIGNLKENPIFLKNAIIYLSQYNQEKKQIIELMSIAYNRNWITTRDGNVSIRKGDKIYITKSGVNKSKIQLEDVLEIPIINNQPIFQDKKVSIEFMMHWLILQDKDFGAVIHLHPPNIIATMELGWELSLICKKFPEISRYTRIGKNVDFFTPGSHLLANNVYQNIHDCDIVGMKTHGVTSRGLDLESAFEAIERLEHVCEIVLKSGVKA